MAFAIANDLTELGRNAALLEQIGNSRRATEAQRFSGFLSALAQNQTNREQVSSARDVAREDAAIRRAALAQEGRFEPERRSSAERIAKIQADAANALALAQANLGNLQFGPDARSSAERIAAITANRTDPRIGEEILTQNAAIAERNSMAEAAASQANAMVAMAKQKLQRGLAEWSPIKTDAQYKAEYDNDIQSIFERLGQASGLLNFDGAVHRFTPILGQPIRLPERTALSPTPPTPPRPPVYPEEEQPGAPYVPRAAVPPPPPAAIARPYIPRGPALADGDLSQQGVLDILSRILPRLQGLGR